MQVDENARVLRGQTRKTVDESSNCLRVRARKPMRTHEPLKAKREWRLTRVQAFCVHESREKAHEGCRINES